MKMLDEDAAAFGVGENPKEAVHCCFTFTLDQENPRVTGRRNCNAARELTANQ